MDTEALESFLAVARLGSVSRAAAEGVDCADLRDGTRLLAELG